MPTPHISIVSPVYRAEKVLEELLNHIEKAIRPITDSFEIVLVDDRSPDDSWTKMKELLRPGTVFMERIKVVMRCIISDLLIINIWWVKNAVTLRY